ncbi:MAG: carotenoid biosynthesis protein [Chitinophagales bacterium]|nr:carotenoid biosynthesis protein [Chitinophagales bacterium]
MRNKWFYIHSFNLIIIYIVGICGIAFTNSNQQLLFLQITPLNLIITIFFTLLFHKKWNSTFIASALIVLLFGFFVEVIGVKTGVIFGTYWYGKTLGFKLLEVPVLIGANWFLLVYLISVVFNNIKNIFLFAGISAAVMTLLDVFIEPVAIRLDFWQWQNNVIPLQNYIAWYLISFLLFLFFRKVYGNTQNRIAIIVLAIQFLFFAVLNLLL